MSLTDKKFEGGVSKKDGNCELIIFSNESKLWNIRFTRKFIQEEKTVFSRFSLTVKTKILFC